MKRFYIWNLIGLSLICGIILSGCSLFAGDDTLVAYGSDEYENEAGIEIVENAGTFLAEEIDRGRPTYLQFSEFNACDIWILCRENPE